MFKCTFLIKTTLHELYTALHDFTLKTMKKETWEAYNPHGGWFKTATQPYISDCTFEEFEKYMHPTAVRINYDTETTVTTPYTQQDLTFKIADMLEQVLDMRYRDSENRLSVNGIDGAIKAVIDTLGLQLSITDLTRFECGMNKTNDELPF